MSSERQNQDDLLASADTAFDELREPLLTGGGAAAEDPTEDPAVRTISSEEDDARDVVLYCCPLPCQQRQRQPCLRVNHNVLLNLILAFTYGMSEGLWGGTVFAAYLKRLGSGKNSPVGAIEAINGLAVLISALPVGYLADTLGRSRVIRAGGILLAITAAFHIAVLDWIGVDSSHVEDHEETNMILLGVVMALWGIGGGIVSGPCQALYADSTPAGQRSTYYQYLFVCYILASCLGPTLSIVLFQTLGDDWELKDLRIVCYVGLGIEFVNALIMLLFDDSKALDEGEQQGPNVTTESRDDSCAVNAETPENDQNVGVRDPLLSVVSKDTNGGCCASTQGASTDSNVTERQSGVREGIVESAEEDTAGAGDTTESLTTKNRRWIPYIMFFSSLTLAIGSGMTVKFFPLFFKDEIGMSPTQVQIIYVLIPAFMVVCSTGATTLASWFGRVQTSILVQSMGVSCLFAMVFFANFLDHHKWILVPVYVVRTALMNCPYPIQESILMDFVPKQERARWKSLESIAQFGWCGSAFIGGFISDRWDYSRTFLVTALIQSLGTLLFVFLLPLVPRKESDVAATTSSDNENSRPSRTEVTEESQGNQED